MKKVRARGLSFPQMMSVPRIGPPVVSPDGDAVLYVVATPALEENRIRRSIHRLDLGDRRASELTPGPGSHSDPAWSPDGSEIAFVSTRDTEEGTQLWILPARGGEARRLTTGYGGASTPVWSPDGRRIAFVRSVVVSPHYQPPKRGKGSAGPTSAEIHGLSHPRSSARISDSLLFRHWDQWRNRHRKHVFLVDVRTGRTEDLTPFDCDAPPLSLGSDLDLAWSPEGDEVAYVMNPDEVVARSTNNSIFLQSVRGLRAVGEPRCISTSDACDCHPCYSPDGATLAYLAMDVPGYEADRRRIKIFDRRTGSTETHLEKVDRSPDELRFAADGSLLFSARDLGRQSIYRYDPRTGTVRQLTEGIMCGSARPIPGSPDVLALAQSTHAPAEIVRLSPGSGFAPRLAPPPEVREALRAGGSWTGTMPRTAPGLTVLTSSGRALDGVEMVPAEDFWAPGAGGAPVHGYLIRPAGFDPKKRYPLILLIHGGPQSAFGDDFHYRWNAQLFASRGACVAMVNPRGSIGYGQKFTDQISGDWGGRCYEDIQSWLDALLAAHRFLDPKRVAAAGASFGGFMVNWIAGHTDRFRALVSHDGIFNAETMAYTTEELWFDEHEHGGLPHEKRREFLKFSPHLHVARFRTPTLVVQGAQDYRCPESEGLAMFTALQVMGVESRFLHFPDEGHWVMQPANSQVWYEQVLGWMMDRIG